MYFASRMFGLLNVSFSAKIEYTTHHVYLELLNSSHFLTLKICLHVVYSSLSEACKDRPVVSQSANWIVVILGSATFQYILQFELL